MKRQNISTGAPWEDIVGYSRAVRVGNQIEISGTVSIKNGEVIGKEDAYSQTVRILEIIEETLGKAGASMKDVIRTRMLVTNIERDWQAIGKAHGEIFKDIKPATTMVEVNKLIDSDYLLEIEATALVED